MQCMTSSFQGPGINNLWRWLLTRIVCSSPIVYAGYRRILSACKYGLYVYVCFSLFLLRSPNNSEWCNSIVERYVRWPSFELFSPPPSWFIFLGDRAHEHITSSLPEQIIPSTHWQTYWPLDTINLHGISVRTLSSLKPSQALSVVSLCQKESTYIK